VKILIHEINLNQLLPRLLMSNIFFIIIYLGKKMQVNNVGQHGEIIYPQNIKKYFGSIQPVQSKSKSDYNKVISFFIIIKLSHSLI